MTSMDQFSVPSLILWFSIIIYFLTYPNFLNCFELIFAFTDATAKLSCLSFIVVNEKFKCYNSLVSTIWIKKYHKFDCRILNWTKRLQCRKHKMKSNIGLFLLLLMFKALILNILIYELTWCQVSYLSDIFNDLSDRCEVCDKWQY